MPTPTRPRTLDFWRLARSEDTALTIGHSGLKDVARFLDIRPAAMKLKPRSHDGWPGADVGDLYFQFDPEDRLQGVNFGFRTDDSLPRDVEDTLRQMVASPDDRLAVNGQPIGAVATLQGFVGALGRTQPVQITGRDSDKWLRLSIETPATSFHAEFVMKALKVDLNPSFTIDYCLYGLSVMRKAAEER